MSNPIYQASYTGEQVEDAIRKALPLEDFSYVNDEIIDSKSFHVLWKVKPTLSNIVSGISIHPVTGQLCEIVSDVGSSSATSVKTYARTEDAIISSTSGTTVDVGGIKKGASLNGKSVAEVIEEIFFPYVAFDFTGISTSSSSGTKEYGTSVTVSKVTPTFTAGSEDISSVKIGTTEGGSDLYSGTSATSGSAITLTTNKVFNGTTGGTIYCTLSDGTTSTTKSATVSYTYYDYSKLTTSATAEAFGATKQPSTGADNTYSYTAGQYLWLYSRSSGKKIQTNVLGQWADVDTTPIATPVTLTLGSGATATYYAYRTTDKFSATGSARYRLA